MISANQLAFSNKQKLDQTEMLSFLRNQNQQQSLKGSTDKSQSSSKPTNSEGRYKFYKRFIEQGRLISCKIINVNTTPSTTFHRSYATYQIQLLTQDIHYSINRRYSQFRKVWNTVDKYIQKKQQFPPKTIWRSSIQEQVTTQRVQSLNKFLRQIVAESTHQEAKITFFEFIRLFEAYQEREISFDSSNQPAIYDADLLVLQILKLNQHPRNIIGILQEISKLIFEKRVKVNTDLIKQIFYGFQHRKGLIELVFSTTNEMIAVQGIKLLKDLLDPEKHRDYQFYTKVFLMGSHKTLCLIHHQLLLNSHLKKLYFEIIQLYIEKKQSISASHILSGNQDILYDFQQWFESRKVQNDPLYLTKQRRSSIRISKSQNSLVSSVFELKQNDYDLRQLQPKSQNSQINQLFKQCIKSCQPIEALRKINLQEKSQSIAIQFVKPQRMVKISLSLQKSYEQNLKIFRKGFVFLKESYDNQSKVQCSQRIHRKYIRISQKAQKKIKYKQFTIDSKSKDVGEKVAQQSLIARKPIHSIIGDFCFVLIGQLTKVCKTFQEIQQLDKQQKQQKQKKQAELQQESANREYFRCVVQYVFGFCHKNVEQYFGQQIKTKRLIQKIKQCYQKEQKTSQSINID